MQKIIPTLWFDINAEESVNFYVSIFKNSKINEITRYGNEGAKVSGLPKGAIMTINFTLNGQDFIALNGGPIFKFSEAISFLINCKTQEEIDFYWTKLIENGGQESQCGWLKDKYGVSWQVAPDVLDKMLADKDKEKINKVMIAMVKMKKIIIEDLEKAYNEK